MKTKRRLAITGIVIGALLTLAPVFGAIARVYGMIRAFDTLAKSGVDDPRALADNIGTVLLSTATGLFICPFGIVILTLSIIYFNKLKASLPPPLPAPPTADDHQV